MDSNNTRKFKVKTMDGRSTDLETSPDIGVEELKREVEQKLSVPVHRQRLIYKSRLLKSDQKLSDHVTQDNETIHLMAMTEEQARSRSQSHRESNTSSNPPNNQPNIQGLPNFQNLFGQNLGGAAAPGGGQDPNNPFGNIMGMVQNMMQNIPQQPQQNSGNLPGGVHAQAFDMSSLFGGQPMNQPQNQTPSSNANTQGNARSQNPAGGVVHTQVHVGPDRIVRVTSRSVSGNRRQRSNNRVAEENKEPRTASGVRAGSRIALPHPYLYEANMISNQLMGPGAGFPGPALPPNGQPRTVVNLLGGYLTSLQFTMSRINPYIWRAGELLQREPNLVNPLDRADAQQLINQIGRALESLSRALLLSAHFYRDIRLGEQPGHYRVVNNPNQDFRDLNERFTNEQIPGAATPNQVPTANTPTTSSASARTSTFASAPTGSSSTRTQVPPRQSAPPQAQPGQPQPNPLAGLLQNVMNPQNMGNLAGLFGNFTGNIPAGGATGGNNVSRQNQQPASTSNATSGQQRDAEMTPNNPVGSSNQTNSREEHKEHAQNRQQNLNNNFMRNVSNVANMGNENPISQAFQSMMPLLNGAMSGSGGNPMTQTLGSVFPEDREGARSFFFKVIVNLSLQDLIAIMNGNYEVVSHLHPRMRDILISQYMNGEDTPANRQAAAETISQEVNENIVIPEEVKANVVPGSDPLKIVREGNRKHTKKLVNMILDNEHDPNDTASFIKRVTRILRWWIGEIVDGLKPCFTGSLQDVLKFIRGNIEKAISSMQDPSIQFMTGMFTDTIMQSITKSYNEY